MAQRSDLLHRGPEQAQRRLVLLHGWGADADDLLELGPLLVGPEVSVVALRAPEPHPYGPGRQWYGLQPIDWEALPPARQALQGRLEELGQSVPLSNTVLLGFSQGGAMALDVGSGMPLALLDVRLAAVFCAVAAVFHFMVFWYFGLNRFFWAWLATFPAILYAAS